MNFHTICGGEHLSFFYWFCAKCWRAAGLDAYTLEWWTISAKCWQPAGLGAYARVERNIPSCSDSGSNAKE